MVVCDIRSIACRMGELLDELSVLNSKAVDMDISLLDKKIDQMMPELGFSQEDNDRLVASYRSALTASTPTTHNAPALTKERPERLEDKPLTVVSALFPCPRSLLNLGLEVAAS